MLMVMVALVDENSRARRRKVQNEGGNADEADFPELLGITLRAWRHGELGIILLQIL